MEPDVITSYAKLRRRYVNLILKQKIEDIPIPEIEELKEKLSSLEKKLITDMLPKFERLKEIEDFLLNKEKEELKEKLRREFKQLINERATIYQLWEKYSTLLAEIMTATFEDSELQQCEEKAKLLHLLGIFIDCVNGKPRKTPSPKYIILKVGNTTYLIPTEIYLEKKHIFEKLQEIHKKLQIMIAVRYIGEENEEFEKLQEEYVELKKSVEEFKVNPP